MNMAQAAVGVARDRECSPCDALVFTLVLLRGGAAEDYKVVADLREWKDQYGYPTWDKLEEWAATLDIEAGIAAPLCWQRANISEVA